MSLIVQKFGGSSVADAERLRRVAKIITDTYSAGNLAYRESPGECSATAYLDDYTLELLKSLLVTLLDSVGDGNCVSSLELWERSGLLIDECLLYYFDQIHLLLKNLIATLPKSFKDVRGCCSYFGIANVGTFLLNPKYFLKI